MRKCEWYPIALLNRVRCAGRAAAQIAAPQRSDQGGDENWMLPEQATAAGWTVELKSLAVKPAQR